ncbi:hypothetical protein ACLB2K_002829 [Fragaria x ananassa]
MRALVLALKAMVGCPGHGGYGLGKNGEVGDEREHEYNTGIKVQLQLNLPNQTLYIKTPKPSKGEEEEKDRGRRRQKQAKSTQTENERSEEGEENKRSKKQKKRGKETASQQEGGALTLALFISFAASLSFCLVPCSARSPKSTSSASHLFLPEQGHNAVQTSKP